MPTVRQPKPIRTSCGLPATVSDTGARAFEKKSPNACHTQLIKFMHGASRRDHPIDACCCCSASCCCCCCCFGCSRCCGRCRCRSSRMRFSFLSKQQQLTANARVKWGPYARAGNRAERSRRTVRMRSTCIIWLSNDNDRTTDV